MTHLLLNKQKKNTFVTIVDNKQVQLDWIKGLVEQIEFANRVDVLPDYILQLRVAKRWSSWSR